MNTKGVVITKCVRLINNISLTMTVSHGFSRSSFFAVFFLAHVLILTLTGEDSCLKLQANFQGRNSCRKETDEARKSHLLVTGSGVSLYANGASRVFVIPEDLLNLEPLSCNVPPKQTALCSIRKWKSTYLYNSKSLQRSRLPMPYYSNSVATNRTILQDGDIEVNPGPDASNSTVGNINCPRESSSTRCVKCLSCEKPVQNNHKRFICILCKDLYHAKCIGVQYNLNTIRADKPHEWTCP